MARWTRALMRPGTRLMRQMRMPAKLSLLGLLLLLPLLLLIIHNSSRATDELKLVREELDGTAVIEQIGQLINETQRHRTLLHRQLNGDATAAAALAETRAALKTHTETMAPGPLLGDDWAAAASASLALADGKHAQRRDQAFEEQTAQIERLREIILLVAERSGLLLDPDADTYFLMDLAVERMTPWSEALGQTVGYGSALLARGDASSAERASVLGRTEQLAVKLHDIELRLAALSRAGVEAPAAWTTARDKSSAFARKVRDTFTAESLQGEPAELFSAGDSALASVVELHSAVLKDLNQRLQLREARLLKTLAIELLVSTGGVIALLYLGLAFYLSFMGALRALASCVEAVAQGDMSRKIDIHGRDELASIGGQVEAMSSRLSAMVAEIRSSAVRVGLAGQQVAGSGEALSQRTEAQATSVKQTITTVAHLSEAVATNASAAQELDALTLKLRKEAEAGGAAMDTTVKAMGTLEDSSRRVAEIIGVIDGIAFQTNILALNAAVEAARAGEAGRGFAVVASEVRQLAQRSASAAAEIRQLIGQSTEQVGQSVTRIQQVGQTLATVVAGVRNVSERLRGIAAASAEQSAGLHQVSQSVASLDDITRQNAQMVEESSHASSDLVARATVLSDAVAAIRLRQGSADEARALVDRAVGLVRSMGLAAACNEFHKAEAGFVDRDLYVFIVDREGRYHTHAAKPAMEGKRVHEVPGIDGDRFTREAWAATQGSQWVEYDIVNPETGAVQPKASFVQALDERLLLGCGIYRQADPAASRTGPAKLAATGPSAPRHSGSSGLGGSRALARL
ncbi:methyl-accepting chemotaxis protein [Ideonella margarita]|uniref:Methyl-accepting chemotaxis protein n=1 Tax=Ideonella margarita TaxID=2984191 RepID=A0ABU9C8I7_9BURK